MRSSIKEKIFKTCEAKIAANGGNVGLSFLAFFAKKRREC